jgi:hypothetical protein
MSLSLCDIAPLVLLNSFLIGDNARLHVGDLLRMDWGDSKSFSEGRETFLCTQKCLWCRHWSNGDDRENFTQMKHSKLSQRDGFRLNWPWEASVNEIKWIEWALKMDFWPSSDSVEISKFIGLWYSLKHFFVIKDSQRNNCERLFP